MSRLKGVEEIRAAVNRLAPKLGLASIEVLDTRADTGAQHVEVDDRGYNYIGTERGKETGRRITPDLDELLYWILSEAATELASRFELKHRRPREDSRRQWFAMSEELLGRVDPRWGARLAAEHAAILAEHGFADAGPEKSPHELATAIADRLRSAYGDPPDLTAARLVASSPWSRRNVLIDDLAALGKARVLDVTDPGGLCRSLRIERAPEALMLETSALGPFAALWRVGSSWPPGRRPLALIDQEGGRTQLERGAAIVALHNHALLLLTREELGAPAPAGRVRPGPAPSTYEALFGRKLPA